MADLKRQDDMTQRTCSINGCDRPHCARGWCRSHWRHWRRHGDPIPGMTPRLRYRFDESFFDSVDTEEKAYWLGFITADGCVRTDRGRSRVQIKLMETDASHLEKLKAAVGSGKPLTFSARRGVAGPAADLTLTSPHLVEALAALGVTARKSAVVRPWDGPDHLMTHYWRGLFDGDGCISKATGGNKWALTLCGSGACITEFAEWASEVCGATSKPYYRSNIWYWKVSGLAAPQALARHLYGGASVYLDRKYERAQRLINETPIRDRSKRTEYCISEGCTEKAQSRNMCQLHYKYSWVANGPECAVSGCVKKRFARGYCSMHYNRLRKFGTAGLT